MDLERTLVGALTLYGACSLVFTLAWIVCGWYSRQADKENE